MLERGPIWRYVCVFCVVRFMTWSFCLFLSLCVCLGLGFGLVEKLFIVPFVCRYYEFDAQYIYIMPIILLTKLQM
jgi:hypothetical protein